MMPTSDVYSLPIIIETVKKIKPNSVLDIGCGFGKYGFLLREHLDICRDQKSNVDNYKISRINWKTKIDAVEVFENYICELQRYIYNNIYIGNIVDLIENLNKYDVILLADVIEHFYKEQGNILLDKIYEKTNRLIIITTPLGEYEQAGLCGNVFEKHRSVWRVSDFKKYSNKKFINIYNHALCIFISKENSKIELPKLRDRFPINEFIKNLIYSIFSGFKGDILIQHLTKLKRSIFSSKKV